MIYLDHAATTPLSPTAWAAMEPYLRERFGNPSEPHQAGRAARAGLEQARGTIAAALGADPADCVVTGGGSEADNIAVLGSISTGGRVVASAIEHPAVREPLRAYQQRGGEVAWAPVTNDGVVDIDAVSALVGAGDALCCLMWANNVTGALQPVEQVAAICAERGVPLHIDAVQAAASMPIDVGSLAGQVTVAVAAHKLGGPKGVGALVGPGIHQLVPVLRGGGQEAGLRPGTENVAGAAGLAAALAERQAGAAALRPALAQRRDSIEQTVRMPVAAQTAPRLPSHTLLLTGVRGDLLVALLDQAGICVAAGAACASAEPEPSHVLSAMGIPTTRGQGALRVSLGPATTDADVDAFLQAFTAAHQQARTAALSLR